MLTGADVLAALPPRPAPPVFRVVASEHAVRAFRGDQLVGSAVVTGHGSWHMPLPSAGGRPQWRTFESQAQAVSVLQGLRRRSDA